MKVPEFWKKRAVEMINLLDKVWPPFMVLVLTAGGLYFFIDLAEIARVNGSTQDINNALKWAKEFLGLAATLAGFLGVSIATRKGLAADKSGGSSEGFTAADRVVYVSGGVVSILAGATLLGVGDWYVPAALAITSTGVITVLVRKFWNP